VDTVLAMARFPSLVAGLAVPFILALSAWGLDLILHSNFLKWTFELRSGALFRLNLQWLLIILLVSSIRTSYDFVKPWLKTRTIPGDLKYHSIISQINPGSPQWIEPPYGDRDFIVVALDNGIKLTNAYHLWGWKNRTPPPAYLKATRDAIDPSNPNYAGSIEYLNVLAYPDHPYAYVDIQGEKTPCRASAWGGNIDVDCQTNTPGQLVVTENSWTGWSVKRDGVKVSLGEDRWLTTSAPDGTHHYEFRYRPWDMPLGALLSLLGWGIAAWLWFQKTEVKEEGKIE
jgi:hypothetical protein